MCETPSEHSALFHILTLNSQTLESERLFTNSINYIRILVKICFLLLFFPHYNSPVLKKQQLNDLTLGVYVVKLELGGNFLLIYLFLYGKQKTLLLFWISSLAYILIEGLSSPKKKDMSTNTKDLLTIYPSLFHAQRICCGGKQKRYRFWRNQSNVKIDTKLCKRQHSKYTASAPVPEQKECRYAEGTQGALWAGGVVGKEMREEGGREVKTSGPEVLTSESPGLQT